MSTPHSAAAAKCEKIWPGEGATPASHTRWAWRAMRRQARATPRHPHTNRAICALPHRAAPSRADVGHSRALRRSPVCGTRCRAADASANSRRQPSPGSRHRRPLGLKRWSVLPRRDGGEERRRPAVALARVRCGPRVPVSCDMCVFAPGCLAGKWHPRAASPAHAGVRATRRRRSSTSGRADAGNAEGERRLRAAAGAARRPCRRLGGTMDDPPSCRPSPHRPASRIESG